MFLCELDGYIKRKRQKPSLTLERFEELFRDFLLQTYHRRITRRLIVLSTIGEGESARNVHSYYKHLFMTTILRGVMKAKAGLEAAVKHSDLEWIVVRPAGLSNGDPKGIRIVKPETEEKVRFVTRSDVAHFMLQQVTSDEYLHQAVGIANPEE